MLGEYRITGRRASEIAADVERAVAAGELAPGATLPPLRDLAAELGINPNTVAAAYRLLRERGVIETAGRRGSRIRPRPVTAPRDQARLPVPPGARDVSAGNPDPALLPPLGPALAAAAAGPPVLYGDPVAEPELLAGYRAEFRADGAPEGELAVCSGALDTIARVLSAHLRPGDAVAVEDPGWGSVLDLLPALGLRAVPVPVDDQGPLPDPVAAALDHGARALIVTSRAQNPTGAALTPGRAAALRAVLAARPATVLIEDDHGHGMVDQPFQSLATGTVTHWALVRSAAKELAPDLRVAVCVGDADTVARVLGRQRLDAGWVSHLLQRAVLELRRHRPAPAPVYRARREALLAALAAHGVRAHGVSGLNVWIPVPDETAAAAALLQRGWVTAPGARFRQDSPPGIRITVSTLDPADAPALAAAVAAVLHAPAAGSRLT
ncbi:MULTISPECIES: aminotransferase class I/II-fold pyridoxal phosphate-dependent enzyme [Kitasatospora]|uniref:Putative GntR family transcriptional regulator n=1 Tax=Kitasatospora setae (strain ATCC 33774 / DSM 43861 / JCM 3304 / KCC A-0304 / NBRC 14216 / KM-6054) TaxID=452652 RepID=E4N326_KITSK|nr:aminotransferase class I/II-fold pyridoxal phosphate-dependent enzyme [Kitasatospora setae]BAJ32560.1 putative GntR family transcriptional regulator [Kitasatospora setae KM-6054]